jgi:ribosome-binding factor A
VDGAGPAAARASATGLIRSEVGRQTGLRHTPSLAFELDTLPDNARNIEDLVARARAADAKLAAARAGAEPAGDPDPYRVPGERQSAADADAGSAGAGREPGTEVAAAADGDVRAGAGGDGRGPGEGSGSHLGGSSPGAHHGAGYSPS